MSDEGRRNPTRVEGGRNGTAVPITMCPRDDSLEFGHKKKVLKCDVVICRGFC
ncbi:unnamed protein product, partial [Sphenostylis stenocarpa]